MKDCKNIRRLVRDEYDYQAGWSQTENRALYFLWGVVTALAIVWVVL